MPDTTSATPVATVPIDANTAEPPVVGASSAENASGNRNFSASATAGDENGASANARASAS